MTFVYNSTSNGDRLSCQFDCSQDLFDENTVKKMGRRFHYVLSQLFAVKSNVMEEEFHVKPIRQLSLILPEEAEEIHELMFTHLWSTVEEGMFLYFGDDSVVSLLESGE
jgi:hypothetical protein